MTTPKASITGGTVGTFLLHLGTVAEPVCRSEAIRELRHYLDRARTGGWMYAEPLWQDEAHTTIGVLFQDSKSARSAKQAW